MQIESHLKLALRGLEANQHQVQELVAVVKDQSQQIERQSQQIERQSQQMKRQSQQIERQSQQIERQSQQMKRQSQQIERQSQQIERRSGQRERLMSKDEEQSENMERLMSTVQDQPPQRERRGPISQIFPTPFEWKIHNIQRTFRKAAGSFSFVSEPFYLFSIGYKYLLKIQLSKLCPYYLGVFIKIVPGEFDESLSWPCKEKVRVTVVNQNPLPGNMENMSNEIHFKREPFFRPLHDNHPDHRFIVVLPVNLKSLVKNDTILITVN